MKTYTCKNKIVVGILMLLSAAVSAGICIMIGRKKAHSDSDYKMYADKHLAIMRVFNQWMETKQKGKSVVDFLHENGIKTVAIYGMSFVGERLYDELKHSDIKIEYAIDKNADNLEAEIDILKPDGELPHVDLIIVTAVYFYNEIENELSKVTDSDIISIDDILYEI